MPNAEFLVNVGVKLDKNSLESLKKQITDADIKPLEIDIKFKSDKVQKELNTLRKDLQEILKISTQIGKSGFGSVGGATKGIKSATNEYLKLYREHANLQKLRLKLIDEKDVNGVKVVEEMMRRLGKDLTAYEKQLGKTGLASVAKEVERIERGLTVAQAKFRDSSNTKEMDAFLAKYKELTDLRKRKANLIDDKDIEQAKQLEREIAKVKSELKEMSSGFTMADFTPDVKAKMSAMGQAVKMEIAKVTDKANAQAVKDQQKVIDAQVKGVLESRKKLASLQNDELKLIWADGTKEELGKVRKEIDKAFKDFQSKRSELNKLGKEMGQDLFAPIQSQLDEFDRNYARQTAKTDDIVKTKWWDSQAKQQQAEVKAYVDSIKEYQTKMKDLLSLKVNGKEGTEEFALLKKEVDEARLSVEQMGKALTHKYGESVFDEYNDELNKLEANIQRIEAKAKDDMMGKQYAQGLQEYKKGIKELVDLQIKADKALQEGEGGQAKFERYSQQIEGVKAKLKSVATEMAQTFGKDFLAPIQSEILKSTNKLADFRVNTRNADVMKDQNRALEQYKKNVQQILALKKERLDLVDANDADGVQKVDTLIHQLIGSCKELRTAIPDDMMDGVANSWKSALGNLNKEISDRQKAITKMNEEYQRITSDTAKSERSTGMTNLEARWNKLSESVRGSSKALEDARKAQENLDKAIASGDITKTIQAYKQYQEQVKQSSNAIRQLETHQKALNDEQALNKRRDTLSQNIDKWLSYNSGASEKFKNQMREIQRQLNVVDSSKLSHLEAEFRRLDTQAELAGQKVMSFGDRLKMQFTRFSAYFSVSQVFMAIGRGAREAFENVKNLDTAMTELKKVTDESDSTYASFLSSAKDRAVELSTTMTDYINSTADFARLGYNFTEAQDLASVASKYNVVGDDLESIDEATGHLISTMRAFQMESSGAISIVDKLNEVSNNFAVTSGNLGSGLEVASSALYTAGNDLDQTIALITGGTEITQDANSTARGIRTIALRIRGMDKELEDLGEDTEGMISYTPKLRKELQDMAGVDIMDGTGESLRSTYDILGDLAHRWGELNDVQKAGLTESLAGKNRANVFNALMTNWEQVESAYDTAKNSAGSADAEFKRYQDSIQAKINQLKASLEGLSESVLGADFLKGAIDGLRGFVEAIDWVLDKIGMLPILLSGAFTAFSFKNSKAIWQPIVNSALDSGNQAGLKFGNLFKNALNQLSDGNWFSGIEKQAEASGQKSGNSFAKGLGRALMNLTFGKVDVFSQTAMQNFASADDLSKLFRYDFDTTSLESGAQRITEAFSTMSSTMRDALLDVSIDAEKLQGALGGSRQEALSLAQSIESVALSQRQSKVETLASTKSLGAMKALVDEFNGKTSNTGLSRSQLADSVSKSWKALGTQMQAVVKQEKTTALAMSQLGVAGQTAGVKVQLSMVKVTASLFRTKMATLALRGAFMALQTAGAMLLFLLVGKLVEGASKLAHHFEEVRQKARETATDFADSVQNVNGSITDFANTRELYEQGVASKEELASSSKALADALGLEANQVANLESTYGSLANGLGVVISGNSDMVTSITESTEKLRSGIQALGTDWNKSQNGKDRGGFWGMFGGDNGLGGTKNAMRDLRDSMKELFTATDDYVGLLKNGSLKNVDNFLFQTDGARNAAQLAKEYEQALVLSQNYQKLTEADRKKNEKTYKKTQKYLTENREAYEEYIKDRNALIADSLNQSFMSGTQNGLPKSQAQFQQLRDSMARTIFANKELGLSWDEALDHANGMLSGMSTMKGFLEADALGYEALGVSLDGLSEKMENVKNAMTESVSGTGLTTESIDNITKAYGDLKSFNPEALFERTANGISLNTEELQRLNEEQNRLKIKELNDELKRMTELRDEMRESGDTKGETWYDSQIAKCKDLIAQYQGAMSAYNKWQQALSSANEGAMYDNITSQLENMKKLRDEGLVGTDDFKTFVGFMSDDTAGKNAYQLQEIFDKGYPKLKKYFTEGSSGAEAFLKELNKLDSSWAHMGKDGWEINLDNVSLKDVSDKLAEDGVLMSQEAIEIMARKLRDYGFDIDLDSQINIDGEVHGEEEIVDKVEQAIGKVNDALVDAENKTVYKIDIDVDATADGEGTKNLEYQLNHAKELIDALNSDDTIDIKVRDAQLNEAQVKLYALLQTLHDPNNILTIDTSSMDYNTRTATEKVQNYLQAVIDRDYQARIGADTSEADKKLEETKQKLSTLTDEDYKKLGIEVQIEGEDKATQSAKKIRKAIEGDKAVTVKYKTEEEGSGKKKQETVEVKQTPDPLDVHVPDSVSVHLEGTLTVPEVKPVKVKLEAGNVITPKVKTGQAKINYNKIGKQAKPKAQSTTVNYSKLGKQTNPKAKDTKVNYSKIGSQKNPSAKSASISYTPIKYQEPPKNKTAKVTYTNTGGSASGTARVTNPTSSSRRISGMTQLYGTAHAQGTAFKGGNWGARDSGVALMGELGQELLVHNGRWQLVGEDGAGFYSYQKGDINKIVSVYSNVYEKFI